MISVVIPLYNKEAIVELSLQSVLSQSFRDFEIIVVDDGSTDHSAEITKDVADPRIRLVSQGNGGPSKARNTGIREAKGEWILFLDADDELLPGALEHFYKLKEAQPYYEMFCCSSYCVDEQGNRKEPFNFKEGLLKNPFAAHFLHYYAPRTGNTMVSRRVALACLFNEDIRRFEDVECFFRMFKKTKVWLSPVPVMQENRVYAAASHARENVHEDFVGHINLRGKSFWERLSLYRFYLGERDYYKEQIDILYPKLPHRYDLMLAYKIVTWLNGRKCTQTTLTRLVDKYYVGGIILLVCAHKPDSYTRNKGVYKAIQVGSDLHPDMNLGYQKDNTGENISSRNAAWSELTAIYWGWKNVRHVEYMGLCHYRRYLDVDISEQTIERLIQGHDILLCDYYKATQYDIVSRGLITALSQEDYWLYIDTMLAIHPDTKDALLKYMYDTNTFVPYTIFVARKALYDEFCEFMFPVLFELEKRILPHSHSRQRRVIGYFGEWTLGLFVIYKNLKARKYNLVMSGQTVKTCYPWWRTVLGNMKRAIITRIIGGRHPQTDFHVPQDILTGFRNDGIKLWALHTN